MPFSRVSRNSGLLLAVSSITLLGQPTAISSRSEPAHARQAIQKVLPLLQQSAQTWSKRAGCYSCHHQGLGMMAVTVARERGFPIDEKMLAEQIAAVRSGEKAPEEHVIHLSPFGAGGDDPLITLASAGVHP